MQDFKHRRSAPKKPWLKRRLRLSLRRRNRASLPKGFRPLPVPTAAERESARQLPQLRLVRPPVALLHGAVVLWLAAGAFWNGWGLLTGPLEKVRLSGNVKLTGGEVLAAAGLASGMPMSDVDPIQVTRRLTSQPVVGAVDVRRVYPGSVWIDLQERTPDLRVSRGNRYALVDAQNIVVTTSAAEFPAALPRVHTASPIPEPGERLLDPGLQRARDLLRQLADAGLPVDQVREIDTTRAYMLGVRFADGRHVLLSADRSPTELRILRELTDALPLRETLDARGKTLDLRAAVTEDGRVTLRP